VIHRCYEAAAMFRKVIEYRTVATAKDRGLHLLDDLGGIGRRKEVRRIAKSFRQVGSSDQILHVTGSIVELDNDAFVGP